MHAAGTTLRLPDPTEERQGTQAGTCPRGPPPSPHPSCRPAPRCALPPRPAPLPPCRWLFGCRILCAWLLGAMLRVCPRACVFEGADETAPCYMQMPHGQRAARGQPMRNHADLAAAAAANPYNDTATMAICIMHDGQTVVRTPEGQQPASNLLPPCASGELMSEKSRGCMLHRARKAPHVWRVRRACGEAHSGQLGNPLTALFWVDVPNDDVVRCVTRASMIRSASRRRCATNTTIDSWRTTPPCAW